MDKLEQYDPMCGLSQDEYRKFLELRKQYWKYKSDKSLLKKPAGLDRQDLYFIIESLELIAENRASQIDDLLEQIG